MHTVSLHRLAAGCLAFYCCDIACNRNVHTTPAAAAAAKDSSNPNCNCIGANPGTMATYDAVFWS